MEETRESLKEFEEKMKNFELYLEENATKIPPDFLESLKNNLVKMNELFELIKQLVERKENLKKEWEDIITEALGVEPIRINSNLFSAQNRPRIYWTNIPINELPKENKTVVYDILEVPNFHNNYPKWLLGKFGNKTRLEQLWYADGKASCLTSNMYKGQKSTFTKDMNENIHRLTVVECERLQTVPDNYTEGVSNTDRYKILGNGWTVDVIAHIFGGLS